jgi:hypothetical protein
MSSVPTPQKIWHDARWLAQAADPNAGLVRFVEMTPDAYRDAAFLDDRMLQKQRVSHLLKWSDVASAMPADARNDARWIFHIGHVGSTLIARLLGELDGVLAVREPRALRDLTFFPREVRDRFVPTVRALMSRTFDHGQTAVVKATSMVSEIAAELIGECGRALFLFAAPSVYLKTMLAGERSQAELQSLASFYSARAEARGIPWPAGPQPPAQMASLVWACEMSALEEAAAELPSKRVLWRDFDAVLEKPEVELGTIASFLGIPEEDARIAQIAGGPLMRRYSKALEHEFGPEARRELLDEAAARHAGAIRSALALLDQAAEKAPALARALSRSTTDR